MDRMPQGGSADALESAAASEDDRLQGRIAWRYLLPYGRGGSLLVVSARERDSDALGSVLRRRLNYSSVVSVVIQGGGKAGSADGLNPLAPDGKFSAALLLSEGSATLDGQLLSAVGRTLRPGGTLLMQIAPPSGRSFSSLSGILRLWTWGPRALENVVRRAGFTEIQLYLALPNCLQPKVICPVAHRPVLERVIQERIMERSGLRSRLKLTFLGLALKAGIMPLLVHCWLAARYRADG